jgi:hypothetical protein
MIQAAVNMRGFNANEFLRTHDRRILFQYLHGTLGGRSKISRQKLLVYLSENHMSAQKGSPS